MSNSKLTEVALLYKYWPKVPTVKPHEGLDGTTRQFMVTTLGWGLTFIKSYFSSVVIWLVTRYVENAMF